VTSLSPQQTGSERHASDAVAVMIVEDEALIAFSLEDILAEEGYRVVGPFSSCADALVCLAIERPDLAIVDATLRDGSCIELARELRRRDVPFMIYSGTDPLEKRAPELDGIMWVEKPATLESVLRAMRRLEAPRR
jgi:DNA-binding response OmpR family regulator